MYIYIYIYTHIYIYMYIYTHTCIYVQASLGNVVRWRNKGGQKQSNTKIVRWSDGTMTMHVGKEVSYVCMYVYCVCVCIGVTVP